MTYVTKTPPPVSKYDHEPIFESAHQAMLFAFTFSAVQHGTAGAAERQIALQARERYEKVMGHRSRGLKGLDGAAQAGMIKSRVLSQPALEQAAIIARFARLTPAEQLQACNHLFHYALAHDVVSVVIRSHPHALLQLVRRHFGLRVNVPAIAELEAVNIRTVWRWRHHVKRWCERLEDRALLHAQSQLEDGGVIPRRD